MEAGMKRSAKLPMNGVRAKAKIWMTNILRKANGRPIVSESQPQKSRPAPLKIEIVITRAEATPSDTPVSALANGAATEIHAAPAVTFKARISQRMYQLMLLNASSSV